MPLDMTDERAMKWKAASGKYDPNNFIHRMRFYRIKNGLSIRDLAEKIDVAIIHLIRFEQLKSGRLMEQGVLTFEIIDEIVAKLEPLMDESR